MNLPLNTLLQGGKYKIVRFINSGGFGCTYEAEHVMLEKKVAIKEFFVKDFCNRDEHTAHVTIGTVSKKGLVDKLRRKFIDEAKGLCKLQHSGIVSVSDVFEENGTAYFVMDFIEGKSLSDIVNYNGPMAETRALRYIRQVANALQYVHDNNRLHLDVKPANIMIDANDNAVLIDFGASKQYDEQDGENTSTLLGKTPGYAPLEQMGNDVVKFMPATDIYALGATLYKLLTGKTPPSSNLLATGEELPPLPSNISNNVCIAIEAAMQTRKDKRPQTVHEFIAMLDENSYSTEATVLPELFVESPQKNNLSSGQSSNSKPKSSFNVLYLLGVFVAITLIGFFFLRPSGESGDITEEPAIKSVSGQLLKNSSGKEYKYTGPVDDFGMPHGIGEAVYTSVIDGGTYTGNFSHGVRTGLGTFITSDGTNKYEGKWKDDMYDEGTLTYDSKGSYFIGSFKNNTWHSGKFYTKDHKFDGEIVNGEFQ